MTNDHVYFFFFNDTATTEIYTLSLHDALPIYPGHSDDRVPGRGGGRDVPRRRLHRRGDAEERRPHPRAPRRDARAARDRKSTRLNSSHANISYAVFCLKKKKIKNFGFVLVSAL